MSNHENSPVIPLPRGWPQRVKSAMLNVIAMAQYSAAYTRSWAVNSPIARQRLKAENDQLPPEVTGRCFPHRVLRVLSPVTHTPIAGSECAAPARR